MSSLSSNAYSVSVPTGRCIATGREIAPGEVYVGVLRAADDAGSAAAPGFVRADYSIEAWDQVTPDGRRRILGAWRATMPMPGAKRPAIVDDATLQDLFEQTSADASNGAEPTESQIAFRYVLALLLLRRKLLVVDASAEARRGVPTSALVVRARQPASFTGPRAPAVVVHVPELSEADLIRQADQLMAVLTGHTPAIPETKPEADSVTNSERGESVA